MTLELADRQAKEAAKEAVDVSYDRIDGQLIRCYRRGLKLNGT